VAGKYEIEALIGQGGMGVVYRAQHVVTHRRVALTWLLADDEAMRMRFVREARAMGALEHPNVVGILDIGEEDGAVYLVMEYVEGESLREHLDRQPVSPARAVRLLMPALEGVAAVHQAGIVHRDLKPANLYVCLDRDGIGPARRPGGGGAEGARQVARGSLRGYRRAGRGARCWARTSWRWRWRARGSRRADRGLPRQRRVNLRHGAWVPRTALPRTPLARPWRCARRRPRWMLP